MLDDEATKIFLNTSGNMNGVDTKLREFPAYVQNTTDEFARQTKGTLVKEIHKGVKK